MNPDQVLLTTKGLFPDLKPYRVGKVREMYDLDDKLLFIATDRVSAFDVVMLNGIPFKGKVLNNLSAFWFNKTRHIIDNHFITTNVDEYPQECQKYKDILDGRSMLVKKARRIDIEAVVRAYLSGSAWKAYKEKGEICGIKLPQGLVESSKLEELIFTPAAKNEIGHDENVTFKKMIDVIIQWRWAPEQKGIEFNYSGAKSLTEIIRDKSIKILAFAGDFAKEFGIIIADTKFEFGIFDGNVILIDEILTPDSSRFWPLDQYEPGRSQPSFDKQFLRDWLEASGWDKNSAPSEIPDEIIMKTSEKYLKVLRRLTGIVL
ncbi:MAG: phosphoribosylaminoimidazolesuccinocarboxamide synthase [Candidatus Pacebacteria bacterium]|nr:phosphoribosylaminoimidazolesuccinocarboxamide synthase [Candidatus Paceibacterota bacterium]